MNVDARTRTQPLQVMRVVLLGLILGQVLFVGVALLVDPLGDARDPELGAILLAVTGVLLVTNLPLAFVFRAQGLRRAAGRRAEALAELGRGELPHELVGATILAGALVEGAGLFGAVTFLLSRQGIALVAPAAAVLALLWLLPAAERLAEDVRNVT